MNDYFIAWHEAYETCGNGRHVFASQIIPPDDSQRCECGAVTVKDLMLEWEAKHPTETQANDPEYCICSGEEINRARRASCTPS